MNIKKIHYLFCVFTIVGASDLAAGDVALTEILKTTGKIFAGGAIGGAAAIAFKTLSPGVGLPGVVATGLGATLLATRVTTMVDINKSGKGLWLISELMGETNWFNILAVGVAATEYGLWQHGHRLTDLLTSLAQNINTTR